MNTKLLQKCIDKLSEENPNIPYVLGILETLKEIGEQTIGNDPAYRNKVIPEIVKSAAAPIEEMTPEEKDYYAKMAGGTIAPIHEGD